MFGCRRARWPRTRRYPVRRRQMRSVRWSAVLLLPLLVACDVPVAPVLADGAQRFDPPPVYELWWDMVTACSGQRALLSRVRWYVVPGAHTVEVNGERYAGYWTSAGNAIVLAGAAVLDGSLVRHEMLHSVIKEAGHPRAHFLERCGGVVVCEERCIAGAEPLPPVEPSIPRVGADVLEVDMSVSPESPSLSRHGGHFTLTVTAHNPRSHPIVVTLPPSTDAGPPVSFEYRIEYQGGASMYNDRAWDQGIIRFGPGETKRQVYDFYMTGIEGFIGRSGLGPGTYHFRAAYGRNWAATSPTVTLP